MAGKDNLTSWGPDNPPPTHGRPKGSRNRSTIVREILETLINQSKSIEKISGKEGKLPIVDAMTFAIAKRALSGDVFAFKELMDSGFGKVMDEKSIFITNPADVKRTIIDDVYEPGTNGTAADIPAIDNSADDLPTKTK